MMGASQQLVLSAFEFGLTLFQESRNAFFEIFGAEAIALIDGLEFQSGGQV